MYDINHPSKPSGQASDGFYHDMKLVAAGYAEWMSTGRIPDVHELSERLNTRWYADLRTMAHLIEQGKKQPDETPHSE